MKSQDTPEPARAPELTGVLLLICMICERQYGQVPCLAALDGQVSHGLCGPSCTAAYRTWAGLNK